MYCISFSVFSQQKTDNIQLKVSPTDSLVNSGEMKIKADTAIAYSMVIANYAYQIPGGDMAKRFKSNSSLGAGFLRKTKSNLLFGGDAHFIFGGSPKENTMLDNIKTSNGDIIDQNGRVADVRMYERGYDVNLLVGKVFSFGRLNRNSGAFVMAGVGFLQHKIRIESIGNNAFQLSKDYREGYDRMTNGMLLTQNFGFIYLGEKRLTNFYFSVELKEGLTQGRRYNFDTMKLDNSKRTDLFYGLRFGWIVPLNSREPEEFYYF